MKPNTYTLLTLVFACTLLLARADSGWLYTVASGLSSSKTTCVVQDRTGYIWVGTEYGLNRYDGYRYTAYLNQPADSTSLPDNEVTAFLLDRTGRLWVGLNKGLALYRPATNDFQTLHFPSRLRPRVESIVETRHGDLLVGTAGYGIFAVDTRTMAVGRRQTFTRKPTDEFASRLFLDSTGTLWRGSHLATLSRSGLTSGQASAVKPTATVDLPLGEAGPIVTYLPIYKGAHMERLLFICTQGILQSSSPTPQRGLPATATLTDAGYDLTAVGGRASIRTAVLGRDGTLYIGTSGRGVLMAKPGEHRFTPVGSQPAQFDLSTANVNALLEDKDGNLWASCYNKGLFLLSSAQTVFRTHTFSAQGVRLGSSVSSIASDGNGGTWLTVQKSGIYHLDASGHITAQRTQPDGANTIHRDQQGRYWLGTENELYQYDAATGKAQRKLKLDGWGINCMADDGHGTLFVSNFGKGFVACNTLNGSHQAYSMEQTDKAGGHLVNDWVKAMLYHSRRLLLTACADGLSAFQPDTRRFTTYKAFSGKQCLSLCSLRASGDVLVGTDKGLYRLYLDTGKAQLFPHSEQMGTIAIYAIVEDRTGDLWLATSTGIWQHDHKAGNWIAHTGGSGLATREYVLGAALHDTATDAITFGIGDGLTSFLPQDVRRSATTVEDVRLTRLVVGGREQGCTDSAYTVDYQDNTLTLEFSLLTFHDRDNTAFDYRLSDHEPWTTIADGGNAITLTKLEPGTYHLEVRATRGGIHSQQPLRLLLRVRHPWYSSPLAWAAYALLAALLIAFIVYYIERRRTIITEEAKMRFLINATHDIRSPLTLILGPLAKLKERLHDSDSQADIETIDHNAQRLLLLVNQILDERRIDKGQMRLACEPTDLIRQTQGLCSMYQYNAHQRGITLAVDHDCDALTVWIDRQNFDKVLSNLLGNAFKYTPDGGEIRFRLSQTSTHAVLTLTDSGPGLRETHTDRLFERFYQGRNAQSLHIEGTGIGLNLSRAIVLLHGGTITAYNRRDGRSGATFEVSLPLGHAHLKPEQLAEAHDNGDKPKATPTENRKDEKPRANRGQRIMVVDDDHELAAYVAAELSPWFHTVTHENGRTALQDLLTTRYDLVISDVVMPEMDGLALLRAIKTNPQLSDVPVILLTSKSEADHRVEGLRKGADGYIAKPFNMAELRAMAINLIDNVRRLRGKFSGAQQQEERREHIEVKGNDDQLMERIMRSLNAHISEPDFRVDSLTQDVGISRAQLHRRLKELTGLPAGEFIRNLRMDEAARLLREGKVSVTQVAFAVGFVNQSHFSTAFHKRFGMTPSEYLDRNHQPPEASSEQG